MTQAPFSSKAAVRTSPNRILPALLLLAGLLFALVQYFISDPGTDGGSGIGGTGRFGDSGIGGTGGPVKFGALDLNDEDQENNTLAALPAAAVPLADAEIDVASLRLAPIKPMRRPAQPQAVPASPREALDLTVAGIEQVSRTRAAEELDALKVVEIDLRGEREEFDSRVRRLIASDLDDTARDVSVASTEITRELIVAQAELRIRSDALAPVIIDVTASEDDERRRMAIPVRPERPDRPSVPAQRFTPPQRGVPTPPVRPMRL